MHSSPRRIWLTALVGVLALTAGCNAFGGGTAQPPGPSVTTTKTRTHPTVTKTVLKGYPTYRDGATTTIGVPSEGASLTITAGHVHVSRSRIQSYGYDPENGYYVTFKITAHNTGHRPLLLERLDFWVKIAGMGKVNTNQGAAPYSGAPTQLDTTELAPGDRVSNDLTFDVSHPHGKLFYGPGGKPSVAWRF